MRISVAADERTGVAEAVVEELRRRGHEPLLHGALNESERDDWAWASEAAARDVADGRADQAVVACWTGTGASIAANKVPGIRAALCADAETARGARKWNDANVLALSLRSTSRAGRRRGARWRRPQVERRERAGAVASLDEPGGARGDPRRLVRGRAERRRRRRGQRPARRRHRRLGFRLRGDRRHARGGGGARAAAAPDS